MADGIQNGGSVRIYRNFCMRVSALAITIPDGDMAHERIGAGGLSGVVIGMPKAIC